MKPYLVASAAIFCLFAASFLPAVTNNVQPILSGSGTGKVIFPENATPATISAASGALTISAGGTDQSILIKPSGIGALNIPNNACYQEFDSGGTPRVLICLDGANPDVLHIRNAQNGVGGNIVFEGVGGAVKSTFNIPSALFRFGDATTPTYAVDSAGDVNAVGVFRRNGTAGLSTTITPGSTVTTLGGIVTANTAAGTPTTSSGSVTGTNNSWHDAVAAGTVTSFTVTWGGTFNPNACVISPSTNQTVFVSALSSSSTTISSLSNMAGTTIYGICQ